MNQKLPQPLRHKAFKSVVKAANFAIDFPVKVNDVSHITRLVLPDNCPVGISRRAIYWRCTHCITLFSLYFKPYGTKNQQIKHRARFENN